MADCCELVEVAFDLECTLAWLVLRPKKDSTNDPILYKNQDQGFVFWVKLTLDNPRPRGFNDEVVDEYDRLVGHPRDRPNLGTPNRPSVRS